jgi:hypothetical protein
MFDPSKFVSVTASLPDLTGGVTIGGTSDMDVFANRMGAIWKKTPIKGVYGVWKDSIQITCRDLKDGRLDVAIHQYDTVGEFKKALSSNTLDEPLYHTVEMEGVKYPAVSIITKLKSAGLWNLVQ